MIFTPTSRAMVVYDATNLLEDDKKVIIISINEEGNIDILPPYDLPMVKNINDLTLPAVEVPILILNFTDIYFQIDNYTIFDEVMAEQIFSFVDINNYADVCLVHCHAGVSRSPAVCAGLSLHYNKKCDEYFRKHVPNPLVFYKMVEQSYKLKTNRCSA